MKKVLKHSYENQKLYALCKSIIKTTLTSVNHIFIKIVFHKIRDKKYYA